MTPPPAAPLAGSDRATLERRLVARLILDAAAVPTVASLITTAAFTDPTLAAVYDALPAALAARPGPVVDIGALASVLRQRGHLDAVGGVRGLGRLAAASGGAESALDLAQRVATLDAQTATEFLAPAEVVVTETVLVPTTPTPPDTSLHGDESAEPGETRRPDRAVATNPTLRAREARAARNQPKAPAAPGVGGPPETAAFGHPAATAVRAVLDRLVDEMMRAGRPANDLQRHPAAAVGWICTTELSRLLGRKGGRAGRDWLKRHHIQFRRDGKYNFARIADVQRAMEGLPVSEPDGPDADRVKRLLGRRAAGGGR